MLKSYLELMSLESYEERLKYLRLYSNNPSNTNRGMMGSFYKSNAWRKVRDAVIKRDLGCDLGVNRLYIDGEIIVHHINPITEEDLEKGSDLLLSMDNLITVSYDTHNKIHYSTEEDYIWKERKPGDTTLW